MQLHLQTSHRMVIKFLDLFAADAQMYELGITAAVSCIIVFSRLSPVNGSPFGPFLSG